MSFYQKKSSFSAFLFVVFAFLSLQVFAQPAKIVPVSEWGANSYEDVVELGDYYYFRQANSAEIDVYSALTTTEESRLGSFRLTNNINGIYTFNGLLVVVDSNTLSLYQVDGVATPERVYGISISGGYNPQSFVKTNNKLAYMDDNNSVYVLQFEDNIYSLYQVYSLETINSGENTYTYNEVIGFADNDLYAAYMIQSYIDDEWISRLLVVKMSLLDDFEVSIEYEGPPLELNNIKIQYLKNGAYIIDSYGQENMDVYGYSGDQYSIIGYVQKADSFSSNYFASTTNLLWSMDTNLNLRRFNITDLTNIIPLEEVKVDYAGQSYAHINQLVKTENNLIALSQSAIFNIELEDQAYVGSNEVFYLGGYAEQVAVKGDKLYVPIQNRIDVVDISSIRNPSLVTQFESTFATNVGDLFSLGDDLLSLTYDYFLHYVIDEQGIPSFSNSVDVNQYFHRSIVDNDSLFILNEDKQILRYNISTVNSLYELPYESEPFNEVLDEFYHAAVVDDYLVAFERNSDNIDELHLFGNISENINLLSSLEIAGYVDGITGFNNYVYTVSSRQLHTYHIDNGELVALPSIDISGYTSRIDVVNGYLMVSVQQNNGTGALHLFSLSNPAVPQLLSISELGEGRNLWGHSKVVQEGSNLFITEYSESGKTLILQLNSAPGFDVTEYTLDEDTSLVIELSGLDPENDELQVEIVVAPDSGTLSFDEIAQTLTYEPGANYFGEQTATIKLLDTHGNFTESDISFTVTAINDTPSFSITTIESLEGETIEVSSLAVDVENDSLTYDVVEQPSEGIVSFTEEGVLVFTSTTDFSGDTTAIVSVTDGIDAVVEQSITITVQDVNDAPSVTETEISLNEDEPQIIPLTIVDVEGHDIQLEVMSFSDGLFSVDVSENNGLNIVPRTHFNGESSVTVKATDELGLTAEFTIAVLVAAINDIPVFNYSSISAQEDTALQLADLVTDADGDMLTITLSEAVSEGVLVITPEGVVTFTPNTNFNGEVTLNLSVTDGVSDAVTQALAITISPVNDAPLISGLSFEMTEDTNSQITLDVSDVENESVTLSVVEFSDGIENAEIDEQNNLSVTPVANYYGQATVTVNVMDENQAGQNFTLTFDVVSVDDVPITDDVSVNTNEGDSFGGALPTRDVDDEVLIYSMAVEPSNGSVTIDEAGAYTYTPNGNFSGNDEFSYTVTDTYGNSVTGKVYISVKAKPVVVPTNSGNTGGGGGSLFYVLFCLAILSLWRLALKKSL
jgi:hypothetical protein